MQLEEISGVEDFARAARDLYAAPDEIDRLQLGVDLAVKFVTGCDHASVTLLRSGKMMTPVASDDLVRRGDAMQYELGEGPCVDAVRSHETVISQDLRQEKRWPRWTPSALANLDIGAMMSLWLSNNGRSYGALNLYADRTQAFDPEDYACAHALAAQVSVAVAGQREIGERGVAMESRMQIGQAQGILMERLNIDAEQAFAHLRRISQSENRKLITICNEIVETRQLPS
jgi:transcriptional regulator with GAF, ATPase, and Fis domain